MDVVLGAVIAAVVLIALYLVSPRVRAALTRTPELGEPLVPGEARIVVEIDAPDADDPKVRRLVAEAAHQVLTTRPDIDRVEVVDLSERVLAVVGRTGEAKAAADVPAALYEPHAPDHPGPHPEEHLSEGVSGGIAHFEAEGPPPHKVLAQLFDLPDAVRDRIREPDSVVDLVRSICEAAGRQTKVDGDLIRCGDDVVVAIGTELGMPVTHEELNRAFFRFRETGARRGIVVTTGLLYPHEIRRRNALEPGLLHAGPDGIQRMADAVALGADPLRFATGTPIRGA